MSELYRPSSGCEGLDFEGAFCVHCARGVNQDWPIVAAAMCFDIDDPEYPREWIIGEDGPRCTAFEDIRVDGPIEDRQQFVFRF